jgi:lipoprotein-anchoring transpeptidase ErfK/SrfK
MNRRKFLPAIAMLLTAPAPAQTAPTVIMGGISSERSWQDAPESSFHLRSLKKEIVNFARELPPGSILVKTSERKLYFVLVNQKALAFPVGVGREGFSWSGQNVITRKTEWPDWRPPPAMLKREAQRGRIIPALVKGGPQNPLGARALYIGDTEYRIHGTPARRTIGRAVSSGCIRMLNEHVIELYNMAQVGARVIVE